MSYGATDIYIWIHYRYQNNILPIIPCLITTYILDNPNKLEIYLDKKLNVNKMLDYIASEYKNSKSNKILEMIIDYVEGKPDGIPRT